MKPTIRPVRPSDINILAKTLRCNDVDELEAATGHRPLRALQESVELSTETWVAEADGTPFMIFGYAYYIEDINIGIPWMLATDEIENHKTWVARKSIEYRDKFQDMFFILTNYVDERNEKTIEWLSWLGFDFNPSEPYGPNNKPFKQFMRVRNV